MVLGGDELVGPRAARRREGERATEGSRQPTGQRRRRPARSRLLSAGSACRSSRSDAGPAVLPLKPAREMSQLPSLASTAPARCAAAASHMLLACASLLQLPFLPPKRTTCAGCTDPRSRPAEKRERGAARQAATEARVSASERAAAAAEGGRRPAAVVWPARALQPCRVNWTRPGCHAGPLWLPAGASTAPLPGMMPAPTLLEGAHTPAGAACRPSIAPCAVSHPRCPASGAQELGRAERTSSFFILADSCRSGGQVRRCRVKGARRGRRERPGSRLPPHGELACRLLTCATGGRLDGWREGDGVRCGLLVGPAWRERRRRAAGARDRAAKCALPGPSPHHSPHPGRPAGPIHHPCSLPGRMH